MKKTLLLATLCVASMITTSANSGLIRDKIGNITQPKIVSKIVSKIRPPKLPFVSKWLKSLGTSGAQEAFTECLNQDNEEICGIVQLSAAINNPELMKTENSVAQATKRLMTVRKTIASSIRSAISAARSAQDTYDKLPVGVETSTTYESLMAKYQEKMNSVNTLITEREAIIAELAGYAEKLAVPLVTDDSTGDSGDEESGSD